MTCSIWSTSKPLDAISVATSTLNFLLLKLLITLSRLFWFKLPFSASALNPSFVRFFAILCVPCFVLAKINTEPSLWLNCFNNSTYFLLWSMFNMSWEMFVNKTSSDSIAILSGLWRYFFDNCIIFAGKVAEKSKVCLSEGMYCNVWSIWTPKPISSILSVSSNTKYPQSIKSKVSLSRWSLILPGVPTIIRGPFLSWFNCLPIASPPIKHAVLNELS